MVECFAYDNLRFLAAFLVFIVSEVIFLELNRSRSCEIGHVYLKEIGMLPPGLRHMYLEKLAHDEPWFAI